MAMTHNYYKQHSISRVWLNFYVWGAEDKSGESPLLTSEI